MTAEQAVTVAGVTEVDDITDELQRTDVGITFGGGVDFPRTWGVLTLDARYTLGLRQLGDGDQIKQDTFAIGGGFIF